MSPVRSLRPWLLAAAFSSLAFFVVPGLAVEVAPAPRVAGTLPEIKTPGDLDQAFLIEIKKRPDVKPSVSFGCHRRPFDWLEKPRPRQSLD